MTKRRLLLAGALLLGLAAPLAAQTSATLPRPGSLSGQEFLKATATSGSGLNIILNHARNTAGYLLIPTGGVVTTTPNWYQAQITATGAITTWTVNLPNPAPDGMQFTVTNATAGAFTTNTTVLAPAGGNQTQTLSVAYANQTLGANGGSAGWMFTCTVVANCTAGTWYRVQ